jgi:3'-phosphoadenosine 5'-phosphosulfate (PAPS) 3'-phosphatase
MDAMNHIENARDPEIIKSEELSVAMELAEQAGEILKKYHRTNLLVGYKHDQFDPVTVADKESDEFLRAGVRRSFPNDEILSEENSLKPSSYDGRVWMIDPLDATKDYVGGGDGASVMIGLLEQGRPKLGVVYLPFRNEWYFGESGKGSFHVEAGISKRLHVPEATAIEESRLVGRNVLTGDVRPIDTAIAQLHFKQTIPEASIGAKIGLIAAREAEAFINTNLRAGKWDTLAAHVILAEAGGVMCDIDGKALDYTKQTSGWDRFFMAACTPELLQKIINGLGEINATTHTF